MIGKNPNYSALKKSFWRR